MIKGEQMLAESRSQYLTEQYEKFINIIIERYLKLDYDFKITIWGGVYTYRDDVKTMKEMVQTGNYGLMPRLLSAYHMTVEDYSLQYEYVKDLGFISDLS